MSEPRFTDQLNDRLLAEFYVGLSKHFKACFDSNRMDARQIYDELYGTVYYTLQAKPSPWQYLSNAEKQKAFTVLNTLFYAKSCYASSQSPPDFFKTGTQRPDNLNNYQMYHHYYNNCSTPNRLVSWALFNSMSHPARSGCCPQDQERTREEKKKQQEAWMSLLLLALVLFAAALTFIALYYVFMTTLNSAERFSYDEGWFQATITLAGMAATGVVSGLLTATLLTAPLTALAFAAGISNPVGLLVFGVVALSIIGAAAGGWLTNQIQDLWIKKNHTTALDPGDPYRFAVSKAQSDNLERLGIDPLKVKCAIIELRCKIGDKGVSPRIDWWFKTRSRETQEALDLVRSLRSGTHFEDGNTIVQVEEMRFDCRKQELAPGVEPYPEPTAPPLGS